MATVDFVNYASTIRFMQVLEMLIADWSGNPLETDSLIHV